ncbi:MAG: hypothetical protein DVB28_002219 [Verrucomicrobia bacterium]|nr:MAG: hypothetical protein DVB28_002219 [Verrucomicrobiota bacterium]
MRTHWHELIQSYIAGTIADDNAKLLQDTLKSDPEIADLYLSYINLDVTLAAHASSNASATQLLASLTLSAASHPARVFSWRPFIAAAAGLVVGLFSASLVFAYAVPQAVSKASRFCALSDGSFEKQNTTIGSGFPADFGTWSGDEATVSQGKAGEGKQALHFLRAQGDSAVPNSPADSCDVFQIVDLRPMRAQMALGGVQVLELSADFLDTRPGGEETLRFGCHLYLFSGAQESLRASWPAVLRDALGFGMGECISEGGSAKEGWRKVTAKCLLPAEADFAVVQIACGRLRGSSKNPPQLGLQFADNVNLILKTQPRLSARLLRN